MNDREYVKVNTSIQTGSNAKTPITDVDGNIEAGIELRLPENLYPGNTATKKVDKIEMLVSKFRLSMENTPIAQLPMDTELSTQTLKASTCQLDVYPYCLLDDGRIYPPPESNEAPNAFPYYKNHYLMFEVLLEKEGESDPINIDTFYNIHQYRANCGTYFGFPTDVRYYETLKQSGGLRVQQHLMNLCAQSNHERYNIQNNALFVNKIATLEQMFQDALENAITYASNPDQLVLRIFFIDARKVTSTTTPRPPNADIWIDFPEHGVDKAYFWFERCQEIEGMEAERNLVAACKPTVKFTEQSMTIAYDTAPFQNTVPVIWNTPFVDTFDVPEQLSSDTLRRENWALLSANRGWGESDYYAQPPPKRFYQYPVETEDTASDHKKYDFTLFKSTDYQNGVMNIICNQAMKDTFSFLPWVKVDMKTIDAFKPRAVQYLREENVEERISKKTSVKYTYQIPDGVDVAGLYYYYVNGETASDGSGNQVIRVTYYTNPHDPTQTWEDPAIYITLTDSGTSPTLHRDYTTPLIANISEYSTFPEVVETPVTSVTEQRVTSVDDSMVESSTTTDQSTEITSTDPVENPAYNVDVTMSYRDNVGYFFDYPVIDDMEITPDMHRRWIRAKPAEEGKNPWMIPSRFPNFDYVRQEGSRFLHTLEWYIPRLSELTETQGGYYAILNPEVGEPNPYSLRGEDVVTTTADISTRSTYSSTIVTKTEVDPLLLPNLDVGEEQVFYILDGTPAIVDIGEKEVVQVQPIAPYTAEGQKTIRVEETPGDMSDPDVYYEKYRCGGLDEKTHQPLSYTQNVTICSGVEAPGPGPKKKKIDLKVEVKKALREINNPAIIYTFRQIKVGEMWGPERLDQNIQLGTMEIESTSTIPSTLIEKQDPVVYSLVSESVEEFKRPAYDQSQPSNTTSIYNTYLGHETTVTSTIDAMYFNSFTETWEAGREAYPGTFISSVHSIPNAEPDGEIIEENEDETERTVTQYWFINNTRANVITLTVREETLYYKHTKTTTEYTYEFTENEAEYMGNVRLTFTWNNLPVVTLSPIQSIVLTLNGVQVSNEVMPINIAQPMGSSLTSTISIIENYYSLATTLRDLHDELVIVKDTFDDTATYSLPAESGKERTIKLYAKFISKDGNVYQIYIPRNGVFSLQLTFGITYFIA